MKILRRKLANIRTSLRAVLYLLRDEFSFTLQFFFGILMLLISYALHLSTVELSVVILVIGAVLAIEALNTAIEELCDHVTPEEHPKIGIVKDLGSGASLLIGIAAFTIGLLIFVPKLLAL